MLSVSSFLKIDRKERQRRRSWCLLRFKTTEIWEGIREDNQVYRLLVYMFVSWLQPNFFEKWIIDTNALPSAVHGLRSRAKDVSEIQLERKRYYNLHIKLRFTLFDMFTLFLHLEDRKKWRTAKTKLVPKFISSKLKKESEHLKYVCICISIF